MKIALVHDYLREYGGAERVVEVMHEIWPEAPLYTSFVDWSSFAKAPDGKVKIFQSMDIRTSWVQHNPIVKKFHSPLRFLAPRIWESFDLSEFDVVLTSSGWFICRGVRAGRRSSSFIVHRSSLLTENEKVHNQLDTNEQRSTNNEKPVPIQICYIHHPPRNLYGYATGSTLNKYAIVRWYASIINFFMRHYDFETAQKVDYFIANSKETARRVAKFYRRDSTVIYPPVEVSQKSKVKSQNHISKVKSARSYYLSVGRLAWAKRIDIIIDACNQLKVPLKIVGTGKEEAALRAIAGGTVEFLGSVSDTELDTLYGGAKALIFCARDEDFGMVPVEAMAHGTPVIGLAEGGVTETVIDGKTGVLFTDATVKSLMAAMKRFEKMHVNWAHDCFLRADEFSKTKFKNDLKSFVLSHYNKGIV